METAIGLIAVFLLFVSFIFLILGLAHPKIFNAFFKNGANRKKTSLLFGSLVVISIVLLVIFSSGTPSLAKIKTPTNQMILTVSGTNAYKDSTIKVFLGGEGAKIIKADDKGKFSADVELKEGENKIKVSATNDKSKTKTSSEIKVVLDLTPPSLEIDQPQTPTDSDKFTLKGKSEKNAQVIIYSDNKELKKTKVKKDSFEIKDVSLGIGENKFTIKAIDEADNYSQPKEITIVRQKPKPTFSFDQPQSPTESDKFNLKGKAQNSSEVVIYSGEKELNKAKVEKDSFEIKDISLNEGENKFTIKAVNDTGDFSDIKNIVVVYSKPVAKEQAKTNTSKQAETTQPAEQPKSENIYDKLWKALDESMKTRKGYSIVYSDESKMAMLIRSPQEDYIDETDTVRSAYQTLVFFGLKAFQISGVDKVEITLKADFFDQYGKSSEAKAVQISMEKAEFQKYNWKELEYLNIYNQMLRSCSYHWLHPSIQKNLKTEKLYLVPK